MGAGGPAGERAAVTVPAPLAAEPPSAPSAAPPGIRPSRVARPWPYALWLAVVAAAFLGPTAGLLHDAWLFWVHARDSVRYLGQIDYGESPLLAQAVLWLRGHQIYHNDAHPPFSVGNYTPLFTLLTAAVVHFVGVRLGAGRAISVASSLATAVCIGLCTWESARLPRFLGRGRPQPRWAVPPRGFTLLGAVSAGCVYLAARFVWGWGVLGRVDALAVCCSLFGVWWVLRTAWRPAGPRDPLRWAALWFLLAVFTRQDAIEGAAASILSLLLTDRRRVLQLIGPLLAGGLTGVAALLAVSRGQFFVHVFLYNINRFSWTTVRSMWGYWQGGAGGRVLLDLGVLGAISWLLGGGQPLPALLLLCSTATSLTVGKIGSSINYFLPLIAACSWCTGLLLVRALGVAAAAPATVRWVPLALAAVLAAWVGGRPPAWAQPVGALLPPFADLLRAAASPGQTLAHGLQTPGWASTPTAQPGPQWHQLIDLVRATPGPVVSEDMSFVVLAGKPLAFQPFELTQAAASGWWNQNLFVRRLLAGDYSLVILPVNVAAGQQPNSSRWSPEMAAAISQAYVPVGYLHGNWVYRPRAEASLGLRPGVAAVAAG